MSKSWHDPDGTLHEIYSAYIFIGQDLLGDFSYDSGRANLSWNRSSSAFFCSWCGEVWGRIASTDPRGEMQAFEAVKVACEKHQDYWNIPGSLLANRLEDLLDDLPEAAIRRELRVHLNYAEKELGV